jgi:hypothetical protein
MEDFAVSGLTTIADLRLSEGCGAKHNYVSPRWSSMVLDSSGLFCAPLLRSHLIVDRRLLLVLRPQSAQSAIRNPAILGVALPPTNKMEI